MLYFYQSLILLNPQLTARSFSLQLNSILSPLGKLGFGHLLFHEASVVLLVGSVVNLPDGIVLDLLLEVMAHSIVTAGLCDVISILHIAAFVQSEIVIIGYCSE